MRLRIIDQIRRLFKYSNFKYSHNFGELLNTSWTRDLPNKVNWTHSQSPLLKPCGLHPLLRFNPNRLCGLDPIIRLKRCNFSVISTDWTEIVGICGGGYQIDWMLVYVVRPLRSFLLSHTQPVIKPPRGRTCAELACKSHWTCAHAPQARAPVPA